MNFRLNEKSQLHRQQQVPSQHASSPETKEASQTHMSCQIAHGLGTEGWFEPDAANLLLQPLCACSSVDQLGALFSSSARTSAASPAMSVDAATASALISSACSDSEQLTATAQPGVANPKLDVVESYYAVHNTSSDYIFRCLSCGVHTAGLEHQLSPQPQAAFHSETSSRQNLLDLSHQASGSKPSGSGSVILFLHGFMGSADDWGPLMQALSLTHHCLALDLPGHGATCAEGQSPAFHSTHMYLFIVKLSVAKDMGRYESCYHRHSIMLQRLTIAVDLVLRLHSMQVVVALQLVVDIMRNKPMILWLPHLCACIAQAMMLLNLSTQLVP